MYGELVRTPKQGKDLIERMARLLRLGVDESKAITDLCSWPEAGFQELLKVVAKFEVYETKDIEEKKRWSVHLSESKMARGEVQTMTNKLLKRISKMTSEYFMVISGEVRVGKLSLEGAVSQFEHDKKRAAVIKIIETESRSKLSELQETYQDKFGVDVIDVFVGAEVTNAIGDQLKQYISKIQSGAQVEINVLNLKSLKPVKDIKTSADTLVVNFKRASGDDTVNDLLEKLCDNETTTVAVFSHEDDQLDALAYLRSKEFTTRPGVDNFSECDFFFWGGGAIFLLLFLQVLMLVTFLFTRKLPAYRTAFPRTRKGP